MQQLPAVPAACLQAEVNDVQEKLPANTGKRLQENEDYRSLAAGRPAAKATAYTALVTTKLLPQLTAQHCLHQHEAAVTCCTTLV